ncbi:cleavage factor protein [Coprinopsis cinerea AmutBmut pab1-1]|nr:cleavage factor protein [Coprinopsis cinerea AmutBmut pab1-1]
MHVLRQDLLPASGVEFATHLKLTPSCLSPRHEFVARVLCNLVVARSNLLRIFEVREEPCAVPHGVEDERERKGGIRRGTEAVEGELAMDAQGDGFINVSKGMAMKSDVEHPTTTRLYLVREHKLHGMVTGLSGVRIIASLEDKLDRLLVSFKDAKIALLEWSDAVHDLVPVSIHTYERAPQLTSLTAPLFKSQLRVDPQSRCAALGLPNHALAILPFLDDAVSDVPYSPSFILDLAVSVNPNIRNVADFCFLPGFNKPTLAVMFEPLQTWMGRIGEYKDTVKLVIFTLDIKTSSYPIITSVDGLPMDSLGLVPAFGGVVITTPNSLIYIDQSSSRQIAVPVNGWASRITDLPLLPLPSPDLNLTLEGSKTVVVDEKTLFVILANGIIYPIEVMADGKTVTKLQVGKPLAQATIPSVVESLGDGHLFVGSTVGVGVVLKTAWVEEEVDDEEEGANAKVVEDDIDMDLYDDDDDLYGDSKNKTQVTAEVKDTKKYRSVLHLSLRDTLPAYGPISSLTFSLATEGDKPVPELVTATGSGILGGFTLFQRDLPTRTKKKILAVGGTRGLWSLPIRQGVKKGGNSSSTTAIEHAKTERDTLILSTDATPSPGVSRIATRAPPGGKTEVNITTRVPGTTVGAAPFFQRTAILVVMTNSIKVLEPDGTERQTIQDMDGKLLRPKIRSCSICDPFVLIIREDDSLGLFIGETERGKIRRKDMSPMGEKTSKYLAGCFFTDTSGLFGQQFETSVPLEGATATLQNVVSGGSTSGGKPQHTQWLLLVRPQGVMEIWTLPKLTLAFSVSAVPSLFNVLVDSHDKPALSVPNPGDPPQRKPGEFDVEQVCVSRVGEDGRGRVCLFVFLRNGQLTIYEALPLSTTAPQPAASLDGAMDVDASSTEPQQQVEAEKKRSQTLNIKFVKISSIAFEIQRHEDGAEGGERGSGERASGILAEHKKIQRLFVPFTVKPKTSDGTPSPTYSGVFFTGDKPNWVIGTDKGGVQIYPSGHNVVHSFSACSLWEEEGEFLVYTEDGPCLIEWLPDFTYNHPLPARSIPRGRGYSNVVFDPSTCLIVAASSMQARFASYDEDGVRVWEKDGPGVDDPITDTSALELISPNSWITMDGFEFATNEYINDISIVTLETAATETGSKDFIAVGTTIDRGEDLAAKGAAYIFEIVEVVPDPAISPTRWYKLRLRCRDDAKGPVTAVCGFQGYLVSSMGQKIFVRAFDSDERLVGVAFMDVGIYVTSLRVLKNLLLIGDAVKSVMFVAFQEDPYKLVLLAKDVHLHSVTRADFFFNADGDLALIVGDEEGIMRIYEYNPNDPDSRDGRYLLLRTEYHGQVPYHTSTTIARRDKEDPAIPQSHLLIGSADGSLSTLVPVDEYAFKRLQLLQGQLTRNIQHVAGLNPKAFRIVKNDYVSKPLSKGILDGQLLSQYESLPIPRQNEMTKQIGTERGVVLRDWIALTGPW